VRNGDHQQRDERLDLLGMPHTRAGRVADDQVDANRPLTTHKKINKILNNQCFMKFQHAALLLASNNA